MSHANEPEPDELTRLERELDILRTRYALFERHSKILKFFCLAVSALGIFFLCLSVGYLLFNDVVVGLYILGVALVALGAVYVAGERPEGWRWIDLASWPSVAIYGIWGINLSRSEAAAIEDMIAEREARIMELR